MSTFVLIHGAYQGGWIWQRVAARLRAAGHAVYAPTLDGCAERRHQVRPGITNDTHGREIAELLFYEDLRDAVLVGTSSGGMVVSRAAELARERVGRVVLADALTLLPGERIPDVITRSPPVLTETTLAPSAEHVEKRLFAELDPETRAWATARFTPHPRAVMEGPVELERFWDLDWKATVIWCRRSQNPPVAHQRRAAERLKADWHEIDTGHYPMLSTPDELVRILVGG